MYMGKKEELMSGTDKFLNIKRKETTTTRKEDKRNYNHIVLGVGWSIVTILFILIDILILKKVDTASVILFILIIILQVPLIILVLQKKKKAITYAKITGYTLLGIIILTSIILGIVIKATPEQWGQLTVSAPIIYIIIYIVYINNSKILKEVCTK